MEFVGDARIQIMDAAYTATSNVKYFTRIMHVQLYYITLAYTRSIYQ